MKPQFFLKSNDQGLTSAGKSSWGFSFHGAFLATIPASADANGTKFCDAGTRPVYRAYNNAYPASGLKNPWDSNHRFTPQLADIAEMVALGWHDEGIVFCAPQ